MGMVDELERLAELHRSGAMTDAEFERAKAKLLEPGRPSEPLWKSMRLDKLRRSATDRWIGGVCGGIGAATGTESWIWRLLFAVGLLAGGITAVLYLLMWLLVPSEYDTD
jgi:phage shock protein C